VTAAIREAALGVDIGLARALFVEYAKWLAVDLCFQGFDRELATLPGAYSRPRGRLLLAGEPGAAFGCIALRPLPGTEEGATQHASVGEVKRLYVQPSARKGGWGRKLVATLLEEARAAGYRELRLDTLERMADARALYARHGFRECAPYYFNPLPDVVYMSREL
jgi:ribosomal protein S18 acetylase RimI-like enzyme